MKKVKKKSKVAGRPARSNASQAAVSDSLATEFRSWIGIAAKGPVNPNPEFTTEDQIWEKDVQLDSLPAKKLPE
jgi:hypothetical protein